MASARTLEVSGCSSFYLLRGSPDGGNGSAYNVHVSMASLASFERAMAPSRTPDANGCTPLDVPLTAHGRSLCSSNGSLHNSSRHGCSDGGGDGICRPLDAPLMVLVRSLCGNNGILHGGSRHGSSGGSGDGTVEPLETPLVVLGLAGCDHGCADRALTSLAS